MGLQPCIVILISGIGLSITREVFCHACSPNSGDMIKQDARMSQRQRGKRKVQNTEMEKGRDYGQQIGSFDRLLTQLIKLEGTYQISIVHRETCTRTVHALLLVEGYEKLFNDFARIGYEQNFCTVRNRSHSSTTRVSVYRNRTFV